MAKRRIKTTKTSKILKGTHFRWVVPRLDPTIWDRKQQWKADVLDRLLTSKTAKKGVRYYSLAVQSHADGSPHLDLLLVLQKRTDLFLDQLDFLCQKHGDLTRYRTLNAAILAYGSKQDSPLSNVPNVDYVLNEQEIRRDPYALLQRRMRQDPFGFDLAEHCVLHDYFNKLPTYFSLERRLLREQSTICSLRLKAKPGIRFIDDELIRSSLTSSELALFHSWSGYRVIVDFLNQIPTYGFDRPFKTPNLLLVGPPNVGKTSLILEVMRHTAVYPVGTQNWFPKFRNHVYRLMFWDEWVPSMMPWQALLMLFQGLPMDLPYKGGSILKRDNQLWIMTHNVDLAVHVSQLRRYLGDDCVRRSLAVLRTRVHEVRVPADKPLFLLLKLIRSADSV